MWKAFQRKLHSEKRGPPDNVNGREGKKEFEAEGHVDGKRKANQKY
jgi:hypothetical protein